jgi:transposase-like protein
MQRVPKRRYTAEFCAEAVKMLVGQGVGFAKAARALDLPAKCLANRVRGTGGQAGAAASRATGDGPGGRERAA